MLSRLHNNGRLSGTDGVVHGINGGAADPQGLGLRRATGVSQQSKLGSGVLQAGAEGIVG